MLAFLVVIKMLKRFALGIAVIIVALGVFFLGLDILDIQEQFRLHLPVAVLNTVFISAVAILVTCIAARNYVVNGSWQMLWLGCGVLAFGIGSLFGAWLAGDGPNLRITSYDSAAFIASVLHLVGTGFHLAEPRMTGASSGLRLKIVLCCCLGVIASIVIVTLLAYQGVIPPFYLPGENATLSRNIVRGLAGISFLASFFIYLGKYYRSRTDFHYWYFLGLILFAFGIIFLSLGTVESRIAWLARVSQYAGSIYFLVAVIGAGKLAGSGER